MGFDAWKDEPHDSLEDAFPDIEIDLENYYQREKEMSALFPTFLSLGQRLKRLLASDVKTIWQRLDTFEQEDDFQLVTPYLYW
jgi:hypothetical protein